MSYSILEAYQSNQLRSSPNGSPNGGHCLKSMYFFSTNHLSHTFLVRFENFDTSLREDDMFAKFDVVVRHNCNYKIKLENKNQRGDMFKFALSDPASKYTISDEAFVRMVIIRQLGNLYPLDVNREGKLYNKLIKVVKEERLDKEKCDSAHTKVLRYLNLIVDGEVYHPIDDEGASDEAAEEYSLEF